MNPSQGTSFIPKRPAPGKVKHRGVRKIYVLTYVSYVLFFGTILAAAGTYFYSYLLDQQLTKQSDLLVSERGRFSQSDMESIRELDRRIDLVKSRMDLHVSVPLIFSALENTAAESMRFEQFTYERPTDAAPQITLKGNTEDSLNSVLFQREVLKGNPILTGATFTDVAIGGESEEEAQTVKVISFSIDNTIPASLIKYQPQTQFEEEADEIIIEPSFDNGPGFEEPMTAI